MGVVANARMVLYREAKRILQRRSYLALLTLLPAVALVIFGTLFIRPVTDLPIALLDCDNSPTSRKLASMIDATAGVDIFCNVADSAEGEHLIRQGQVYAMIILPEGFERMLFRGEQAVVAFYNSGVNLTINGIIERDVQAAVRTFSVGVQLQQLETTGVPHDEAMAMAMPISFDSHVLFNPELDYAAYLVPSFMAMTLLIFAVMATIYAIGSELKEGTACEWLDSAGGSMWVAIVGKLSLPTVVMWLWGGVMFFLLFVLLGVPIKGSFCVLALATAIFIVGYEAMAVLFVVLFDNMRLALSVGGGYSVLSFSFSGVTFPAMAMYAPIRIVGNLFPFTFYMNSYVDLVVRGVPVGYTLVNMAMMMLFGLLPLVALPRLKRMCRDEKFWGKI